MDARYSVTLEWCGQSRPMWIARFCGDWLGKAACRSAALAICQAHYDRLHKRCA